MLLRAQLYQKIDSVLCRLGAKLKAAQVFLTRVALIVLTMGVTPFQQLEHVDQTYVEQYARYLSVERIESDFTHLLTNGKNQLKLMVGYLRAAPELIRPMLISSDLSEDHIAYVLQTAADKPYHNVYEVMRFFGLLITHPPIDDPVAMMHELVLILQNEPGIAPQIYLSYDINATEMTAILIAYHLRIVQFLRPMTTSWLQFKRYDAMILVFIMNGPRMYDPQMCSRGQQTSHLRSIGMPALPEMIWCGARLPGGSQSERFERIYRRLPPELRMMICAIAGGRNPDADRGMIPQKALDLAQRWCAIPLFNDLRWLVNENAYRA